jgi:hypothetical protein
MRDPLGRLLAASGYTKRNYPNIRQEKGTLEEWTAFAHDDEITNNYALSILAGNGCCDGNNTDPIHLQNAKDLVSRFTFVLDLECLNEGMQELADQLGMNITITDPPDRNEKHTHKPPKERIPYPEIYDFLKERNKLDIELYEWSKSLSLVDCAALKESQQQFPDDDTTEQEESDDGATGIEPATKDASAPDKSSQEVVITTQSPTPASETPEKGNIAVPAKSSPKLAKSTQTPTPFPKRPHKTLAGALQIESFKAGNGLLLNIHITHHGECPVINYCTSWLVFLVVG